MYTFRKKVVTKRILVLIQYAGEKDNITKNVTVNMNITESNKLINQ